MYGIVTMTFQRALTFSLGMHFLIFGGALVFAQYGHKDGLRSDMLMVALVGSGSVSQDHARENKASGGKRSKAHPVPLQNPEEARMDVKSTAHVTTMSVKNSVPGDHPRNGDADEPGGEPSIQRKVGEAGSRFGILTPDQRQLIQAALERAKNYPRLAWERGIEGVVHVRFKILPSGDAEHVEILKSSGREVLDSATVRTVYRSGPLPYVKGWVEVPISYYILK
jgi:TonB family protein